MAHEVRFVVYLSLSGLPASGKLFPSNVLNFAAEVKLTSGVVCSVRRKAVYGGRGSPVVRMLPSKGVKLSLCVTN
jgi:hypothetical protein